MHYFKPVSYEIWTRLPAESVIDVLEAACNRWTWKVKRERPSRFPDGSVVHSVIARKRRDLQSLQLEIHEPADGSLLRLVIHPRFLHGFRFLPATPVYALQGPIKRKIERVVRALEQRDPECVVSRQQYEGS